MSRERMSWIVCCCCLAVFWLTAWAAENEVIGVQLIIFGTAAILLFSQFFLAGRRSLLETTIWLIVIAAILTPSVNRPELLFVFNDTSASLEFFFFNDLSGKCNRNAIRPDNAGVFYLGMNIDEMPVDGKFRIFATNETGKVVYSRTISETDKQGDGKHFSITLTPEMLKEYSDITLEIPDKATQQPQP